MVGSSVNDECLDVEGIIVERSEDRLIEPMSGIDRRGDINRTGVDGHLMNLREFHEISDTECKTCQRHANE